MSADYSMLRIFKRTGRSLGTNSKCFERKDESNHQLKLPKHESEKIII